VVQRNDATKDRGPNRLDRQTNCRKWQDATRAGDPLATFFPLIPTVPIIRSTRLDHRRRKRLDDAGLPR
jgi:hypothetical protein